MCANGAVSNATTHTDRQGERSIISYPRARAVRTQWITASRPAARTTAVDRQRIGFVRAGSIQRGSQTDYRADRRGLFLTGASRVPAQISFLRTVHESSKMAIPDRTHVEAVEAFLDVHESALSETDSPAITQLRSLAKQLDANPEAANLNTQFGTVYRHLRGIATASSSAETIDPVAKALEELLSQ